MMSTSENKSSLEGVLMNLTIGNSSEAGFYPVKFQPQFGYTIVAFTGCSVITCVIVMITLLKSSSGNFFKWSVVNRFSMYNAVGDLLFYIAQIAYGTHHAVVDRLYKRFPSGWSCSVHAISILEFAYAQIFLSIAMSVYVFYLVYSNRHISFGKYDYRLLLLVFGMPLSVLVTAAYYDQLQRNIA